MIPGQDSTLSFPVAGGSIHPMAAAIRGVTRTGTTIPHIAGAVMAVLAVGVLVPAHRRGMEVARAMVAQPEGVQRSPVVVR